MQVTFCADGLPDIPITLDAKETFADVETRALKVQNGWGSGWASVVLYVAPLSLSPFAAEPLSSLLSDGSRKIVFRFFKI